MENDRCKKKFPKEFNDETRDSPDGYAVYRRREFINGERVTFPKKIGTETHTLDNRWVVPYNPYLLKKYRCHINVEYCASIRSIKYLNKHVYKGHDRAQAEVVRLQQQQRAQAGEPQPAVDETKLYLDGRYVSASEALRRIYAFPMHTQSPSVVRLAVHLPGQERIIFREGQPIADAACLNRTTLTSWFDFNRTHPELGCTTLYPDFPTRFKHSQGQRRWEPRRANGRGGRPPVGRMYFVNPGEGERYFLRLLLCHVAGGQLPHACRMAHACMGA
jgi:hypothetical protein